LTAIRNATRLTNQVCIRATVSQLNVNGLNDLVDLGGDLGVQSIVVAPIRTELGRGKHSMNLRPRIGDYVRAVLDAMARSMQRGLKFSEPLITQHLGGRFVVRQTLAVLPNGEVSVAGPASDRPPESVIGYCRPQSTLSFFSDRIRRLGNRYFENVRSHCSTCTALAICRGQCRRYDFLFRDPSLKPVDDYYCRLSRKLVAGFVRKMWEGGKTREQHYVDGSSGDSVIESLTLAKSELEYVL
jgi:radical SAM protein with 4Fe4S-binding SPASM domain